MFTNAAILTWMLILPVLGGLAILALPAAQAKRARSVAVLFCGLTFLLAVLAAVRFHWARPSYDAAEGGVGAVQLALSCDWIRVLGAHYFVGVDGLSMPLVLLTTVLGLLACWASYGVAKSPRGYFVLVLFLLSGVIGVFVSLDLLLFFIFFEMAAVPIYFLIGIWGGARKEYAATKFVLFSLAGTLAMFCVVLGVGYQTRGMGAERGGVLDLIELAARPAIRAKFGAGGAGYGFGEAAFWLIFFGCAVKMAAAPVHALLADAQGEAPTPVSMLLAGVVMNLGAYGLVRVAYPLFPEQAAQGWFYVALIGVVSIGYGALVAMAQRDLKRLVAYWSMTSMGFVVLGLAVMTPMAEMGAVFQMISHGLTAALLFLVIGVIEDRAHHREISRLGGLWTQMPMFTGWAALAFFAAMGLPGLSSFVAELLVVLGTFSAAGANGFVMSRSGGAAHDALLWFGGITAAAMMLTVAYLLWTFQRVFMGAARPEYHHFPRLNRSEKWILVILGLLVVVLGVGPMLVLDRIRPAVEGVMKLMTG